MSNGKNDGTFFERILKFRREKMRKRTEKVMNEPDPRTVSQDTKRRAVAILSLLLVVGFLGLIVRIGYINIVHGDEWEQKAINQQLSDTPVYSKRGSIYDRNGKLLATSVSAYTVYLSSAYIKDEAQRKVICEGLSEILGIEYDKLYEMAQKDLQYQLIRRRITDEQTQKIRELIKKNDLNSIGLSEDYKRLYPYSGLLSQVLGFTGADGQGLYGIENYYDSYLTGVNGRAVTAKNAVGTDMDFSYETYIDAQDGYNLVLTIDEVVQSFVEKYIKQMYEQFDVQGNAMGIVMDVNNGEILALAQYPTFDCNTPFDVEDTNVRRIAAISDGYEPGSTFKSLVAAMSLEENIAKPDDTFVCYGSMRVKNRTIHCFKRQGHGTETFTMGLVNSCNPVFMTLGARLGAARFCRYFAAFGLEEKTGIDLPGEAVGISHKESEMGEVELAVSSFGQTFKVTPIQMITAFTAAVNGGSLVQPHLVREITDTDGNVVESFGVKVKRQVVSESTSKTLCEMLECVVEQGGSAKNAYVTGYRVGGKTGTSDKTDSRDEEGNTTQVVASMIAVAPADDPQIAILIIADEPAVASHSGGTVAGPTISNILSEILPYLGIDPVFTEKELDSMEINTPSLVNKDTSAAKTTLENAGLTADVRGKGSKVISQVPSAGTQIPRGGKVIIYTDEADEITKSVVPEVVGLSPAQAARALSNVGLNVRYKGFTDTEGTLRVYEQSIEPDTQVDEGTVVTIYVRVEQTSE